MRKDVSYLRVYASNEPRIGIVRTAMGACAQIAVFTYAVIRRTPRYEIRLAAPFADNLMNSVAHCEELPSATWGVLFVLKTSFFAKKYKNMRFCHVTSFYFR